MGLCELSDFSIFTFVTVSNLKFSTGYYNNSLYLMMDFTVQIATDDVPLYHSVPH